MKRRDFLKCSLAVGAGLAASPSTYAFNGESKETGNDSSKLSKAPATKGGKPHIIFIMSTNIVEMLYIAWAIRRLFLLI